ncbi:hypothetical protein [Taibaiella koreensis]|uniref:hypothetical protein n=1 Tax=Taibaiella koreensis TaxID=1268548 RepID=UPI000E59BBC0|nr:hypothetical protein [Taibaiella koreensis]
MNKFFTRLLYTALPAALITALSVNTQAQSIRPRDVQNYLNRRADGRNVSLFHRFEICYSTTFGGGGLNINDRFRDPSNPEIIGGNSRAMTFNYRSGSGYAGFYFPLSYFSQNSMLALSTGVYGAGSVWNLGNTSLDPAVSTTYDAKEVLIGVPIGVDFIYGGEASLNKSDRVTIRGGIGVMPYFATGQLADGSQNYGKLGLRPYVKAELGFFAGVEWKVKGMIIAGSRTIYDYSVGDEYLRDSDYYYKLNFKIRPTYTVGIAVFPFSFGWDSDKW